jgi:hypothetical protein
MKWVRKLFKRRKCICLKKCDCQNPPPDNWDGKSGVFHVSQYCPVHNDNPHAVDNCPVHGKG